MPASRHLASVIVIGDHDDNIYSGDSGKLHEANSELQKRGGPPLPTVMLQRLRAVSSCIRRAVAASGWVLQLQQRRREDGQPREEAPVQRSDERQAINGLPSLEPYPNQPRDGF